MDGWVCLPPACDDQPVISDTTGLTEHPVSSSRSSLCHLTPGPVLWTDRAAYPVDSGLKLLGLERGQNTTRQTPAALFCSMWTAYIMSRRREPQAIYNISEMHARRQAFGPATRVLMICEQSPAIVQNLRTF
ncbi:hypothetical protein RRG08_024465 [Elysia crispata]|uniref:Uncharacterized protein n=1 Tax=Elysia crispata TaxID=231223 RepID=A0AAE0YPN8_9GAST|nr:hypothetical protein RRG08_024465 [Elysia crispata]